MRPLHKALALSLLVAAGINAHAQQRSYEEERQAFSACLQKDAPAEIVGRLQRSSTSVDARTDDSPITKPERSAFRRAAKTWEACLQDVQDAEYARHMRMPLNAYVDAANGKHKTWMDFYAARAASEKAVTDEIVQNLRAEFERQQREEESKRQQAAYDAAAREAREDARRQADIQRQILESQERAARNQQMNDGINNLIRAAQPQPVPNLIRPQTSCMSRPALGGVQTNCW